jgi:hypothetical protein
LLARVSWPGGPAFSYSSSRGRRQERRKWQSDEASSGRAGVRSSRQTCWKTRTGRAYPVTFRLKLAEQVEGVRAWRRWSESSGQRRGPIREWRAAYRKGWGDALVPKPFVAPVRRPKAGAATKREAVLELTSWDDQRTPLAPYASNVEARVAETLVGRL